MSLPEYVMLDGFPRQVVVALNSDGSAISGAGGSGGAAADRELVETHYVVVTAFTGASVGDIITETQVIDVTSTATSVAVIWRNQTTSTDLSGAPSAANIASTGAGGLTNAQLRATAVPVAVQPGGFRTKLTITRPADVTPYTAGDVVGGVLTLGALGPASGSVLVSSADFRVDSAAIPTGMNSFRLHLYGVTPPSAYADNAAWDLGSGDRASYLGFVDLGAPADVGSTLFVQVESVNKQLANVSTLFGYLVTNGGYTPDNAGTMQLTVHTVTV